MNRRAVFVLAGTLALLPLSALAQAADPGGGLGLPVVLDDLALWAVIVGFLAPAAIAAINRAAATSEAKAVAAFAVSLVAGAGTAYFGGAFTGRGVVSCVMIVFVTAIATYQLWWRPSGIAPAIDGSATRT